MVGMRSGCGELEYLEVKGENIGSGCVPFTDAAGGQHDGVPASCFLQDLSSSAWQATFSTTNTPTPHTSLATTSS